MQFFRDQKLGYFCAIHMSLPDEPSTKKSKIFNLTEVIKARQSE